jgi:hypothetical protein
MVRLDRANGSVAIRQFIRPDSPLVDPVAQDPDFGRGEGHSFVFGRHDCAVDISVRHKAKQRAGVGVTGHDRRVATVRRS